MGVELSQPIINAKSLKYNYTNEGGVGGSIRFLRNIMGMWLIQECRRHFRSEGYEHSYAELTQMAERAKGLQALISRIIRLFLMPGKLPVKIDKFCFQETKQRTPNYAGGLCADLPG